MAGMPTIAAVANVNVIGFDHLVLAVGDVERSLAWYCGKLGLEGVRVEEWRAGEAPFPSVRIDATTIIDFIPRMPRADTPDGDATVKNLDHICLVVEPSDLSALGESGPRYGAQGMGTSVYIEDPDGTVVELRHYG
jgi:catechol 2,3-dioxygenase-like lactoylglutathione lyase family enzyme